jgi:hypothetical protein
MDTNQRRLGMDIAHDQRDGLFLGSVFPKEASVVVGLFLNCPVSKSVDAEHSPAGRELSGSYLLYGI